MPDEHSLLIRPAAPDDLTAVADLFLAVRADSVPIVPPVADPDDARRWVHGWDLDACEVWLAEDDDGVLVGFALVEHDWLHSLYVASRAQGTGVGTALLDLVKARRPGGFGLWVFESNRPARAFYARHGLVEVERTDGRDNMEKEPDVRMVWPHSFAPGLTRSASP